MATTPNAIGSGWEQRFLLSTRGRLVSLLRRSPQTVDELALELGLTDNAVRAHLATLERDGLVRSSGVRRGQGSGKPATFYALTPAAETFFPKAYGELLREVLQLLSERLNPGDVEALFKELASRLAEGHRSTGSIERRIADAVSYLDELGGLAESQPVEGGYHINGFSCPLGALLPGNPNACRLAELLLEEIIGLPVQEHCVKSDPPRCQFDIAVPQRN